MRTMLARKIFVAALVATLSMAPAYSKECKGVSFPEKREAAGTTLILNGLGPRQATAFRVNVYVAALYLPKTSADPNTILASNTPKELVLQFVRDVDGADLSKGWQEGFEKNAKSQLPALHERIEKLKSWMTDMKSGQRMNFLAKPAAGIEVNVNGAAKGTIEGDDFSKAFLSIWLGPEPPNAALKSGLLGGPCA
jgi:hypothetical protein